MNVFIYKGALISRKKKNNDVFSLTKITVASLSWGSELPEKTMCLLFNLCYACECEA